MLPPRPRGIDPHEDQRTSPGATTPTRRKPRPKPERRIRVLEQPTADTHGRAAVSITVGKDTDTYLLRTIPTDFGGTLAFGVEKLDGDLATAESYHVRPADQPEEQCCDCRGFLRWGRCKHRDGLAKSREERTLPALFTARDARHEPERTDGPGLQNKRLCQSLDHTAVASATSCRTNGWFGL